MNIINIYRKALQYSRLSLEKLDKLYTKFQRAIINRPFQVGKPSEQLWFIERNLYLYILSKQFNTAYHSRNMILSTNNDKAKEIFKFIIACHPFKVFTHEALLHRIKCISSKQLCARLYSFQLLQLYMSIYVLVSSQESLQEEKFVDVSH